MTKYITLAVLMALSSTATASTKPPHTPVYVPVCNTNPWKCSAPIRVKVAMGPRK